MSAAVQIWRTRNLLQPLPYATRTVKRRSTHSGVTYRVYLRFA